MTNDRSQIYFSDAFEVSPSVLEEYGAFDVSLLNDLPLFIDPFLLFNSSDSEYQGLHAEIIKYLCFLRDKAVAGAVPKGLLEAWFTFREVKQNWLGYSLTGNGGTGLGTDFANALSTALASHFKSFGSETLTRSSHLEKLCLIGSGVGRDNISDLSTNLIKDFLLRYSQTFARTHLRPDQRRRIQVPKVVFNFNTETWETRTYELPFIGGDYVLLTPTDLLTKDDVWINRADMVRGCEAVVDAVPNEQLRDQLSNYFVATLSEILKRDQPADGPARKRRRKPKAKQPTARQRAEAVDRLIRGHPEFIDYYIRWKEDSGDEAEAQADARVRASEGLYITRVRNLVTTLLQTTEFYRSAGTTKEEARQRVEYLKDVIENKGGWRIFYAEGAPIRRESDLHILFRLTWCNTPSDVNREVNNGRGPSDFEVSRGRFDKSVVEFKLAKSTSLERNLKYQAEIYQKASGAGHALKVVVYFSLEELRRTEGILRRLGLFESPDVVLIDARRDNKQSASLVDGPSDEE